MDDLPCFLDEYSQLMPDHPLYGISTKAYRAFFFSPPEERRRQMMIADAKWKEDISHMMDDLYRLSDDEG